MSILEAKNLVKIYGQGENAVHALDGVNLEVNKGEFLAIVGTSGSGKSTLLHMLGGLDRPTSGEVIVDGHRISKLTDDELTIFRRRKIGFVFQAFNLVPVLNVYENIVLPLELDGEKVDKEFVNEIIDTLMLTSKKEVLPNQLSGGQQQRVAIARALATNPEVIFFDEPTSALDPELIGEVLEVMKELAKEGMTMVVVTHELNFAKNVANTIVFMEDGKILQKASSKEFFTDQKNDRIKEFLRMINNND